MHLRTSFMPLSTYAKPATCASLKLVAYNQVMTKKFFIQKQNSNKINLAHRIYKRPLTKTVLKDQEAYSYVRYMLLLN